VPVEPPPSAWQLPPPESADAHGLVGVGADLAPGTLLAAYRHGLFPMPIARRRLGWFCPDPRGVLPLDAIRVSRSLRKSLSAFEIRIDTAFVEVVNACANPSRPNGWITNEIVAAYTALHNLGWAHSVETWSDGRLAGGLYGVAINGLFAGESMFHRANDASKVALVALAQHLNSRGFTLLDVQWCTAHLESLGAVALPRREYLDRLAAALRVPASF
jgi:leucyl/phenylalanyl-tRNA---protein transferase